MADGRPDGVIASNHSSDQPTQLALETTACGIVAFPAIAQQGDANTRAPSTSVLPTHTNVKYGMHDLHGSQQRHTRVAVNRHR